MNTFLSDEEQYILNCSKEGWRDNDEQYNVFMAALKKYIAHYQSCLQIDFSSIFFPKITFDQHLLGDASICIVNSTFYDDAIFENLIFLENVQIQQCNFLGDCHFEDIHFYRDAVLLVNTFKRRVTFKKMIFEGEAFFVDNVYNGNLLLDTLTFSQEASFYDSLLKQKCMIKNIKGVEWFEWDDLYCINDGQCEWEELEVYIALKDPHDIKLIDFVREIKGRFPELVDMIKEELYQESSGGSCFQWIEKFGYITRDLLRNRQYEQAKVYLDFMDKALRGATPELKDTIEVGYVENILYDLTQQQKKDAWKYLAEKTKESYNSLWGSI